MIVVVMRFLSTAPPRLPLSARKHYNGQENRAFRETGFMVAPDRGDYEIKAVWFSESFHKSSIFLKDFFAR